MARAVRFREDDFMLDPAIVDELVEPASVDDLVAQLAIGGSGIAVAGASLTGRLEATARFNSVRFSDTLSFGRGVLLTTGDGAPPRTNTQGKYSVGYLDPGDPDLLAFAQSAFEFVTSARDATILNLTFEVTDPAVRSIRFNVAFASEEFPEFSGTSFVDIAAVWTGTGATARNYALVNADPRAPLSVIDRNLALGAFIDNAGGALAIEYDGLIDRQAIFVPVSPGINTIRLGVADTGDAIYDSGLFILGITPSAQSGSGVFQQRPIGAVNDAAGGNFLFEATLATLNGASFVSFDQFDAILIEQAAILPSRARLAVGSLRVRLDTNGDGAADTAFTFDDPIINGTVVFTRGVGNTTVIVAPLATATEGGDAIAGGRGLDYIAGLGGRDALTGGAGSDALDGGAGDDLLDGGAGADFLAGRSGADILIGGAGDDTLQGGVGRDTASYATAAAPVRASLALRGAQDTGGAGTDILAGIENLTGGRRADRLTGSAAANVVNGAAGADLIAGRGGADTLVGGDGNDTLGGGRGNDQLRGGKGADVFVFAEAAWGRDVIADFRGAIDTLDFRATPGVDDLDDLLIFRVGRNTVVRDADGPSQVTLLGVRSFDDDAILI
jgi:Ca2+-binding RTX toxin-like protein